MIIIEPEIFNPFLQLKCGFASKVDSAAGAPYHFNLSYSVGDEKEKVDANRRKFYSHFSLSPDQVATQNQTHSANVTIVEKPGNYPDSDALITKEKNLGLVVSSADCLPVFIYDFTQNIIAAVHSGWRGTQQRILSAVLETLFTNYSSHPDNLYTYFGPSISASVYEVGPEVAEQFPKKYSVKRKEKYLLNIPLVNYDILRGAGIPDENIQISKHCTYTDFHFLHSYRKGGKVSGRALGLITMVDDGR